jgi:hypothetical protein
MRRKEKKIGSKKTRESKEKKMQLGAKKMILMGGGGSWQRWGLLFLVLACFFDKNFPSFALSVENCCLWKTCVVVCLSVF